MSEQSYFGSKNEVSYYARFIQWVYTLRITQWLIDTIQATVIKAISMGPVPQHVAFVMDGNRRYARNFNMEVIDGHNLGFEALKKILDITYLSGVKYVTIYAFSIENFKRNKVEVDGLMNLAMKSLTQMSQQGDILDKYGAQVRLLGDRHLISSRVLDSFDRASEITSKNKDAVLNICFSYTSQQEIANAMQIVVEKAANNEISPESIDEKLLEANMFTMECPPVDLLIRTSGVQRLSDFMLWQCHQNAALKFVKCFWPEFSVWRYFPILLEWQATSGQGVTGY